jgi:zinc protease
MFRGSRLPEWQDRSRAAVLLATVLVGLLSAMPAAFALKVEEIKSAKGIPAWLVEERSIPLVAIKFAFMGGAAQDPPDKEGLSGLIADLMTEGAGELPAKAFKEKLSRLGTRLSMAGRRDAVYGGLEALTARFAESAELLRLALLAPRFDADAVERTRAQRLTDLALAANEPTKVSLDRWFAEAFTGHPYARSADGTPESIGRLALDDLKTHHASLFARDVLRVVIVGDIDKARAVDALDLIFGDLPEKAKASNVVKVEPRSLPSPVIIDKDYPLATATFGLPSIPGDHPDFPALQILNHVIGSGDFDSRLMDEVRVKRGLAYSIKTGLLRDSNMSVLIGGFATKNEAMGAALGVVREVLAATARDGPTPAQFENAKRYLIGSYLLDFDTNSKVANSLLRIWLEGEAPDYLVTRNQKMRGVTLNDVRRVASDVLKADKLLVTIVGKPSLAP